MFKGKFTKSKRRKPRKGDFDLQITALADILIVVLVFLLSGISSEVV